MLNKSNTQKPSWWAWTESTKPKHAELRQWWSVFLVLGIVFTAWPMLDMWVSGWFWQWHGETWQHGIRWIEAVHQTVPWLGRAALLWGLYCLFAPAKWCGGVRLKRRSAALGLVMLLLVGLAVNGGFKSYWGRARPVAMEQFAGDKPFTPALVPAEHCEKNCSFVSGHAATGYALMGWAALAGVAVRRRWWLLGVGAGLFTGGLRVLQGGHFLSDTLFAGLVVWIGCWLLRQGWAYMRLRRWRSLRRRGSVR